MSPRPRYDPNIGGIRSARRRAVGDLTAAEPAGRGGAHRRQRPSWAPVLLLLVPLLIVLAGAVVGWAIGAWS